MHSRPFPVFNDSCRWTTVLRRCYVEGWETPIPEEGGWQWPEAHRRNWKAKFEICFTKLANAEPGALHRTSTCRTDRSLAYSMQCTIWKTLGLLRREGSGSYRVTAQGRDHWERLNAPRWYWFRRNWFPASVAGATIVAASVSAAANIVNLVI